MPYISRLILIAASLTACASPSTPVDNNTKSTITNCPQERPQICTMDYRPVCATRDTGVRCVAAPCPSTEQKTYSNACSACADAKVISHIPDECPTSPTKQQQ
jgi:hypothetical protein